MSWGQYLFSFEGRINRARYWKFVGLTFLFFTLVIVVVAGFGAVGSRGVGNAVGPVLILLGVPIFAAFAALFVASLAIYTKRLHDRDKSAWWMMLFIFLPAVTNVLSRLIQLSPDPGSKVLGALIALVGLPFSIWAFVEIGCLRGTDGANRYGPDPLGPEVSTAEVFT